MSVKGIVKGLGITLKHIYETYSEDLRVGKKRYGTAEGILSRKSVDTKGAFTVQYPEEKTPVPEAFRYIPFLVYDESIDGEKDIRCTSCGICAKVCPPQCIWITRTVNPDTGKPVPKPAEFFIDIDICMNCGLCAEFCPFEAIRMDHDYEISNIDRFAHHIYDLEYLLKPASYYAKIRPTQFAEDDAVRKEKEAKKAAAKAAKPA
ncbi:MAG: hypothetical protein CVU39_03495 [Chloroflexi bacterium HGW-Chloroflexi-10]|nr:MAG: hypothetical protein CVU39_03495 [Chloroflexi bacterium HGW-Chloroflexi-10]